MKKKVTIAFVIIGILAISTMIIFSTYKSSEAYRKAKAKTQWECSVVCAEKSTPDSYVITYSDAKILSNTGVLTVQNRNDFDILYICSVKENRNLYLTVFLLAVAILFRMLQIKNTR